MFFSLEQMLKSSGSEPSYCLWDLCLKLRGIGGMWEKLVSQELKYGKSFVVIFHLYLSCKQFSQNRF